MSHTPPEAHLQTHIVANQPPAQEDPRLWTADPALGSYARKAGADTDRLADYAALIGTPQMLEAARAANNHPPELRSFDAGGRRLDEVRYHPGYHQLLAAGLGAGYAALPWEGRKGGHATHAAMVYLTTQVEPGVCCPMTMTYAGVPALQADKARFAEWVPRLTARLYDRSPKPLARKASATMGMAMTEKQAGSDLRATTTTAQADGEGYRLTGHKWFCSAPMSDGFLTLAQAEGGLTCFLVPRWLEGARNPFHITRLKEKLGNRANASAEIEYHNTYAQRLGDEGRGIATILSMVHHTRLDTAMAPAGLMHAALARAAYWATHRSAFDGQLIDKPLMRAVLADLALDWEGALALGLRVAQSFDGTRPEDRAFARIGVALAKYLNNKLCPGVVVEAMEALGGMGFVEDTGLPLLYREAPLNGIWEGAGNVICLDILRTLRAEPLAGAALTTEFESVTGQVHAFDTALKRHIAQFPRLPDEAEARWYAESLATLLTAAVLIRSAPPAIAEAYVTTRLSGRRGRIAGTATTIDTQAILARLAPPELAESSR